MPVRRPVITLKKDQFQKLCSELDVKRATVYNALNYSSNSELAQNIRQKAISIYGGVRSSRVVF